MTTEEFSNEFDILVSSYLTTHNFGETNEIRGFEFSEYEKSVFLTRAQEELIILIYNGKSPFGDSFEATEESRSYLRNLIEFGEGTLISGDGVYKNSKKYKLPDDVWFITYEEVEFTPSTELCNTNATVVPTTHDRLFRIKNNPFKTASNKRVLRVDTGGNTVELISKYSINKYTIGYIKKPSPIILSKLPKDLNIDGMSDITSSILNPVLHRVVLENAVKMALNSRAQYSIK